jgi:nucleotide sugar dehydrogenase
MPKKKKTIAVIGLGYVGLPLALLAERKGYNVIGIDNNKEKIKKLQKKEAPFLDKEVSIALKKTKIKFDSDAKFIKDAEIVLICVPTPVYSTHLPNLEPVKSASQSIAKHLQKGQLIIIESTINPGVSENIVMPILESVSGLKCTIDFSFAHCPERINPGDRKWNVENIPRVVGASDSAGLQRAVDFYESILTSAVRPMKSLKEAEATKIIENTFRDINIAFVNELAKSFDRLGIDLIDVIEGASTKPFSFMPHFPGAGIGGHCIPVDPYYLIEHAKLNGFDHKFLKLAREINNSMPKYAVELMAAALNEVSRSVKGTNIGILGLAYKPNVDDTRESPSYELIKELKKLQANVHIYDPYVETESSVKNIDELLEKSDAIIVATAHNEFIDMDIDKLAENNILVVIDGRNCLDKKKFQDLDIIYKGIGR